MTELDATQETVENANNGLNGGEGGSKISRWRYVMGLEIFQCALGLHAHGLNVIPVKGKTPYLSGWKTWQSMRIPETVLTSWSWNDQTRGLALVLGFGDIRDIEFDEIANESEAANICLAMGRLLPDAWCYRSGSGKGLHFLFRCLEKNPNRNAVTIAGPKMLGQFHHAELRWEKSLSVVPPSKHQSGGEYKWLHKWQVPPCLPPCFSSQQVLEAWQSTTAIEIREEQSNSIAWNVGPGDRHNALCQLVGKLKASKLSNEILPIAVGWNRGLTHPLPEKEVVDTVMSLCVRMPIEAERVERIAAPSLIEYLCRLESFLRRYVVFPSEHESVALALWIAHSWIVDRFEVSPILAVTSAEKRSGKTRVFDCAELVTPNSYRTVLPSEAVTYSILAQRPRPTFFLDESDAIFSSRPSDRTEGLRAIFNSGNMKGTPVFRVNFVKGQRKVESFDCFGSKAIAGIGQLPSTISDRSVLIRMRRRAPDEPVKKFRKRVAKTETRELYFDWEGVTLDLMNVAVPGELNDRAADSWEPLLAIADAAGGDWPLRARRAAVALCQEEQDVSIGVRLLNDIKVVFGDDDHLETGTLLSRLHGLEDSPWGDWYGKLLTARGLAKLLEPYRVHPVLRRVGDRRVRGYFRSDFSDVWRRYTPSCQPVTCVTSMAQGDIVVTDVTNGTRGIPGEEEAAENDMRFALQAGN